jgi:hypothetical protein
MRKFRPNLHCFLHHSTEYVPKCSGNLIAAFRAPRFEIKTLGTHSFQSCDANSIGECEHARACVVVTRSTIRERAVWQLVVAQGCVCGRHCRSNGAEMIDRSRWSSPGPGWRSKGFPGFLAYLPAWELLEASIRLPSSSAVSASLIVLILWHAYYAASHVPLTRASTDPPLPRPHRNPSSRCRRRRKKVSSSADGYVTRYRRILAGDSGADWLCTAIAGRASRTQESPPLAPVARAHQPSQAGTAAFAHYPERVDHVR